MVGRTCGVMNTVYCDKLREILRSELWAIIGNAKSRNDRNFSVVASAVVLVISTISGHLV